MKITVIAVGKLKERWWKDAADEYLKRMRPYATIEVVEIPDRDVTSDESRAVAQEGAGILKALDTDSYIVVLGADGKQRDSVEFSKELAEHGVSGRSYLTFVIGGAAGLAQEVRSVANTTLSLGKMTLPHQLARVVLLEQLYRAFKIMRREPYHR